MKVLQDNHLKLMVISLALTCAMLHLFLKIKLLTYDLCVDQFRTLITLLLFGYGFTPIIRTLTTSISTDTIYTTSFVLFFFSLIFHDYGLDAPIVSNTLSAHLSLTASVFLISRVETDEIAFCLLTLALCAFSFWPYLRQTISAHKFSSVALPIAMLICFCPLSIAFINVISTPLAVMHGVLHMFLIIACPTLLVGMQHFKNTIHGPWDEASLKMSTG